jgi:DNA primase
MARIPDEEIERLKREVSIESLARARGVELKPHGGNLIGLCPFHEDHEPSLVITPAKNLWHCMGACQSGGSVIDWVMKAQGVSFRHAVEILRGDPLSLAAPSGSVK